MQNDSETLKTALVGTARSPAAGLEKAAAELSLPAQPDPARQLLSVAAAENLAHRAGHVFLKKEPPAAPAFEKEDWPACPPKAARALRQILGGAFAPALPEWLQLAVFFKKSPPPAALPQILALFYESSTGRPPVKLDWPALGGAVGGRGRWLAAQHPDWQKLLSENLSADRQEDPTEADWHEGRIDDRLLFLKKKRAGSPAAARLLLEKTWPDEPWEHRARLLAALETGLSATDEAFLEAALLDKRKEVRKQALHLAARLDGGRAAGRLLDFARASLFFDKKGGKFELTEALEGTTAAALETLGGQSGGAKPAFAAASLLGETLALVAPASWERIFEEKPDRLARSFEATGLLPPVMEAALLHKNTGWQAALLRFWAAEPDRAAWASPVFTEILGGLPAGLFFEEVEKAFSEKHFLLENGSPLLAALSRREEFWDEKFTLALFGHLHFWLDRQGELAWAAYHLDDFLKKTIWKAAPTAAPKLRELWQRPPRFSPISAHSMERLWAVLDFRARMRAGFAG